MEKLYKSDILSLGPSEDGGNVAAVVVVNLERKFLNYRGKHIG